MQKAKMLSMLCCNIVTGKSNFIDFLKDAIDTNFVKTKETLLPFKEEKDLYVKAKKSNIISFSIVSFFKFSILLIIIKINTCAVCTVS